jgi:hypothetical protein
MFPKKMSLVLVALLFSTIAQAVKNDTPLEVKLTGDDETYFASNIYAKGWSTGLTSIPFESQPMGPQITFSITADAYRKGKVNRGSYCYAITIDSFWKGTTAKLAQEALAHAKKIQIDPKDFDTDFDQRSHNDSVIELQNERVEYYGSRADPVCYSYSIDPSKITIVNEEGEKLTLEAEMKKNKTYTDLEADVHLKEYQEELKILQRDADHAHEILDTTIGKDFVAKAKEEAKEADDKVAALTNKIKTLQGAVKASDEAPGENRSDRGNNQ